jgi:hypothetical protein
MTIVAFMAMICVEAVIEEVIDTHRARQAYLKKKGRCK